MSDLSTPAEARPIDYAEVLERIGGDVSFLEDLLRLYFEEYAEKRKRLEEALRQQNFSELQELGHGLKGASANLSLFCLQKAALAMEVAGREKKGGDAELAFAVLEEECRRLRQFLAAHPLKKAD